MNPIVHATAIAALEQIYSRTERWEDLIGVYRKRIELTMDGTEGQLLRASGNLNLNVFNFFIFPS